MMMTVMYTGTADAAGCWRGRPTPSSPWSSYTSIAPSFRRDFMSVDACTRKGISLTFRSFCESF